MEFLLKKVKKGDIAFAEDYAKMLYFGIADATCNYVVASRMVWGTEPDAGFSMNLIYSNGSTDGDCVF